MKKKTGFYTGCHRFDHALSPMADGAVTYAYDAWGAPRNPSTGEAYAPDAQPELLLGRGYTGHEHLPIFMFIFAFYVGDRYEFGGPESVKFTYREDYLNVRGGKFLLYLYKPEHHICYCDFLLLPYIMVYQNKKQKIVNL